MRRAWLLAVALAACEGGIDDPSPRIDELAPPEAQVGASVDILGVRFCGEDPNNVLADGRCSLPVTGFVTFGTAEGTERADIASWKAERITVTVPNIGAGVTSVSVTVLGRQSNLEDFEVLP